MGFGVPLQRWLREDLREFLHDLLLAPDARSKAYLDQGYVRRLYEAHCSGFADHSHRLWTLLTFEVWLRNLSLEAGAHDPASDQALAATVEARPQ